MEKAFAWIAKKLGFSQYNAKIAGLAGILVITVVLLTVAIYLFPSVTSGVLLMFAIGSMIGKGLEITKTVKEIWEHFKESAELAKHNAITSPTS